MFVMVLWAYKLWMLLGVFLGRGGLVCVLENFFAVSAGWNCLCFRGCCWFCMVFWALFTRVFAWLSMLLCVNFYAAKREVCVVSVVINFRLSQVVISRCFR